MIEQLVEEVDIFPSLIDLAGITVPQNLQGTSWVPLLKNPQTAGKDFVLMQYPHCTASTWGSAGLLGGKRHASDGVLHPRDGLFFFVF